RACQPDSVDAVLLLNAPALPGLFLFTDLLAGELTPCNSAGEESAVDILSRRSRIGARSTRRDDHGLPAQRARTGLYRSTQCLHGRARLPERKGLPRVLPDR